MKWQSGQSGNPGGHKPGTGKIDKLRAALTTGQLPANQAANILQGLGNLAKLIELDELTRRIEALEGKQI